MSQAVRKAARHDTRSESDRIALVDQLWKLKKRWQEHTGAHVPLNVLIKEVDYRRDVLDGAERSGKPELEDLVRRIRNIEERIGEISSITVQPGRRPDTWVWPVMVAMLIGTVALTLFLINHGAFGSRDMASVLPMDDPEIVFRLHGSNTVGEELAPALLQAFQASRNAQETLLVASGNPVEKQLQFVPAGNDGKAHAVEIHAHGSSTAFRDLAAGKADLGMSSRRIKDSEIAKLAPQYGDLSAQGSEHVIALDGLAVIVHPANPVMSLTKADVARIFSGEVTNWVDVGGPNVPINLYARDGNSGTFDTFKTLVLAANDVDLASHARRFESSSALSDAVAGDPGGIGFIGLPYVRNARALGIAETAGTQAVVPTEFTVSTEDYPLSRRLYFYMPAATANVDMRTFVEFTLSSAGQEVVEAVGLVSQRVRMEMPQPHDGAPARFTQLTRDAERLSVTFRFDADSTRLDNKSMRDIERVIDFMKGHRDRELLLLGFSALDGATGRDLSLARARIVKQMLAARGVHAVIAEGFGDALPVAANDTESGRRKNRRVEVWLL